MSALASSLTFQQLKGDGVLAPIHQAFGETVQRLDAVANSDVVLAAVLCSEQLARGHVCLDLSENLTGPEPTCWHVAVRGCGAQTCHPLGARHRAPRTFY